MQLEIIQITTEQLSQILKEVVSEQLKELGQYQSEKTEERNLLSRQQTCDYFGISKPCLHDWVKNGILKPTKVGGRVYFKQSDINLVINKKG